MRVIVVGIGENVVANIGSVAEWTPFKYSAGTRKTIAAYNDAVCNIVLMSPSNEGCACPDPIASGPTILSSLAQHYLNISCQAASLLWS